MFVTQKNQYALKAIVELAKRAGSGPVKISEIARAQSIPPRFLEVILGQLKGSGFVASKRGYCGGYFLICRPETISVGHVLRFMQGPPERHSCAACVSRGACPMEYDCAFATMFNRASEAVFKIFDETTIQDLVDSHTKGSS
jgi:Rrf2 family cysteine metabolism transcriptional repressor